jgi:large subunit ribosomal protein L21
MFAIIKTGGKQYVVHPGEKIKVEKLPHQEGDEVVFDNVLLFSNDEAKEIQIGTPFIQGFVVKGKLLAQGRGKKIIVFKYKPKKRYHKKQGHRQSYSEVEIVSIGSEVAIKKETETPKQDPAPPVATTSQENNSSEATK